MHFARASHCAWRLALGAWRHLSTGRAIRRLQFAGAVWN
jgi:hypothetical protein